MELVRWERNFCVGGGPGRTKKDEGGGGRPRAGTSPLRGRGGELRATGGDGERWGDWARLGGTQEWGAVLQTGGAGAWRGPVSGGPGAAGDRALCGRGLRVLGEQGLLGSQGGLGAGCRGGWEVTAAVGGHSPRGAQAAGLGGGPAGIGGARGAACARGPVRSRLSRVGPAARSREGRGGGGGTRRPPSPNPAPGLWRPLVGSGRTPSRGG